MAKRYPDEDDSLTSNSSSTGVAIENDKVSGPTLRTGTAPGIPATAMDFTCAPCQLDDNKQIKAVKYCVECNEHLCANCHDMHSKFRISRSHKVLDMLDRDSTSTSDQTETCPEHPGNSIAHFCDNHQVLCCKSCKNVEHKQCTIRNIAEESKGIKDSNDLNLCFSAVQELSTRFEEIKSFKVKQNIDINHQREDAIKHIRELRVKVNNLFDELEENAYVELKHESKDIIKENKIDIETYEDVLIKLQMTLDRLNTVTRSAGDSQIFVTMQRALSQIRKYDQVLNDVECNLKDIAITFKESDVLSEFMKRLKSFGNVSINTRYKRSSPQRQSNGSLNSRPKKRAVPAGGHSVRIQSDRTTCNITGCSFLNDGRIVLADYNNKCIKLFDNKCQPSFHLGLTSRPHGVSLMGDTDVVTSLADENALQLCHVDQVVQMGRRLPTRERYVALICSSRMEIYAACCFESAEGQIHVLNQNGDLMRTIGDTNTEFPTFLRPVSVSISDDNRFLYVSDTGRNCVVCLDISLKSRNNKVVFKYSDKNLDLREGLTIDETGSLYVASSNRTVHQVSYNGMKLSEILTQQDGVDVPNNLCFSRKKHTLVLFEYKANKMKMFALI